MSAGAQPPSTFTAAWQDALRTGKRLMITTKSGARQLVSPRRQQKRELMRAHGITSGRQWRKLKKRLRREAAHG